MRCSRCQPETMVAVYTSDATGIMQPVCTACANAEAVEAMRSLHCADHGVLFAPSQGCPQCVAGATQIMLDTIATLRTALKEACDIAQWEREEYTDKPEHADRIAELRKLAENA